MTANSMKIGELIEYLERRHTLLGVAITSSWNVEKQKYVEDIIHRIALTFLKADKFGYNIYKYDYIERDFIDFKLELNKILKELE